MQNYFSIHCITMTCNLNVHFRFDDFYQHILAQEHIQFSHCLETSHSDSCLRVVMQVPVQYHPLLHLTA